MTTNAEPAGEPVSRITEGLKRIHDSMERVGFIVCPLCQSQWNKLDRVYWTRGGEKKNRDVCCECAKSVSGLLRLAREANDVTVIVRLPRVILILGNAESPVRAEFWDGTFGISGRIMGREKQNYGNSHEAYYAALKAFSDTSMLPGEDDGWGKQPKGRAKW